MYASAENCSNQMSSRLYPTNQAVDAPKWLTPVVLTNLQQIGAK